MRDQWNRCALCCVSRTLSRVAALWGAVRLGTMPFALRPYNANVLAANAKNQTVHGSAATNSTARLPLKDQATEAKGTHWFLGCQLNSWVSGGRGLPPGVPCQTLQPVTFTAALPCLPFGSVSIQKMYSKNTKNKKCLGANAPQHPPLSRGVCPQTGVGSFAPWTSCEVPPAYLRASEAKLIVP